ncbi:hypothetical protein F7R02_25695 [Xanthomonas cissicola]|nr:hypothetical protein F7R02_25695 [Xanthomonas cissicola]
MAGLTPRRSATRTSAATALDGVTPNAAGSRSIRAPASAPVVNRPDRPLFSIIRPIAFLGKL